MAQLQTTAITGSVSASAEITAVSFTSSRATGVGFFGTASFALTASGATGTSGTSGTAGSAGTSGSSGTSGSTGSSGSAGTAGSSGTSGTRGSSGSSGTSGANGSSGSSGATGGSGSSGSSGATGASGSSGSAGSSGTSGTRGSSGSSGTTGANGSSGSSGTSASVTINNNTDNYLVTATGTTNTLNGEANLVFNGSNLGIGTTAPVYTLHLAAADTQNTYPTTASINITNTNSAAFSRTMGVNFSVGAGAPTEVFAGIYGVYTNYTTTVGGAIAFVTNNGSNSFTEKMRIISNGNVGIGTTTIPSRLSISGSSNGSTPVVDIVVGGTDAFSRGVRMINSSMTNGSSLMYAVGQADSARNMGQFYFVYSSAGSTTNRLSMGLHSVDDVFNILGSGMVGIGATAAYVDANDKLVVAGGRLAVNAGAYQAASFNRSNNGIIAEFLVGGGGRGGVSYDGTNFNVVSYSGMNLLTNTTTNVMFLSSSGNVGIATTSPAYTLDVNGRAYINSGVLIGNNMFDLYVGAVTFTNGESNRAFDIRFGNISFWGYVEVEVNATYSNQNSPGKLTKRFAVGTNPNNNIYASEGRVTDALGPIADNIAIGDFGWDATNSTFRIPVSHIVSTGNQYMVRVRMFGAGNTPKNAFDNISLSSVYTLTALSRQYPYYNERLGIGTTSPSATLGVNGAIASTLTSGIVFDNTSGGTNATQVRLKNTGGDMRIGVESSTGGTIQIGTSAYAAVFGNQSNYPTQFTTNGNTRMTIDANGNVGIGTTNATVHSSTNGGLVIRGGGTSRAIIELLDGNGTGRAVFQQVSNTTYVGNLAGAGDLILLTNGTGTSASETMTLKASGNVGIGATSPVERLTVANTGTSDIISAYRTQNTAGNLSGIVFAQQNASSAKINYAAIYSRISSNTAGAESGDISFYTYGSGTNAERGRLTSVGTFYMGSTGVDSAAISAYVTGYNGFAAQVSNNAFFTYSGLNLSGTRTFAITGAGALTVSGDVVAYGTPSDVSYKHDVQQLTNALDIVRRLRGVSFKWNKDTDSHTMVNITDDLGFIAQEVREVLPTIVRENEDGKLSLRDRAIIPLLVEAIKEQQTTIQQLQARIEALETL